MGMALVLCRTCRTAMKFGDEQWDKHIPLCPLCYGKIRNGNNPEPEEVEAERPEPEEKIKRKRSMEIDPEELGL